MEEIDPAKSLVNNDTTDESVLDVETPAQHPAQQPEQSGLLRFSKKLRETSQVLLDYNKIIDFVVDNFEKWDKNAQGCYILKRGKHTLSFDGRNIPQIDDKYFLSDVLTDSTPKSIVTWLKEFK